MSDDAHDLQFTILSRRLAGVQRRRDRQRNIGTCLEALVLQDTLDGGVLARRREFCLEHDAKRAIANDLTVSVLQFPRLARDAVLHLFADDFCFSSQYASSSGKVVGRGEGKLGEMDSIVLPPMRSELKAAVGRFCDMMQGYQSTRQNASCGLQYQRPRVSGVVITDWLCVPGCWDRRVGRC